VEVNNVAEPTNWPDLAMSLWDGLTARNAEITYDFGNLEVAIPHKVGQSVDYATWRLNGVLKIRTGDKHQV
jgi:hypothetical protein